MSRIILLVVLVWLLFASPAVAAPNFVVVMTDDATPAMLDAMPQTQKWVGQRGVTFRNSFAVQSLCCPSRATFLTGQYPHNHGVQSNDEGAELNAANALPVWLENAGYRTGYIGKYLNGYGRQITGTPPGWEVFRGIVEPWYYNRFRLYERGQTHLYMEYMTDVLAEKADTFIRGSQRPFFLTVAPTAPHQEHGEPAVPAKRHRGAYAGVTFPEGPAYNEADVSDKPNFIRALPRIDLAEGQEIAARWRRAHESMMAVDDLVKRLIVALRDTRELGNTIFVFTSDNGFMFGEHRIPEGKDLIYEESARVPLLIRGPGFPRATSTSRFVGNVDVPATILDAAGAAPGRTLDGRSLLRINHASTWREDILFETRLGNTRSFSAVRTSRWAYSFNPWTGEEELYDLRADPQQLQSLHDDLTYDAVKMALRLRLEALQDCRGASCR